MRFLDSGNQFTAQEMVVMSPTDLEAILQKGGYNPPLKTSQQTKGYSSQYPLLNLQNNPEYLSLLRQSSQRLWLAACRVSNPLSPTNLSQLLIQQSELAHISLNDPIMDGVLGHQFFGKGIVDVVGEASSGKTQFCLQIALNAITPIAFGGSGKGAIYVSTEGEFPVKRWEQMVSYRTQKIENTFVNQQPPSEPQSSNFLKDCPSLLLDQLIIERVPGHEQMDVFMNRLRALIRLKNVGVVIIDSITSLLKDLPSVGTTKEFKDSLLYKWSSSLQETSDDCGVAVLTTSHVVDLFEENPGSPKYVDPKSSLGLFKRHSSFSTSGKMVLPSLGMRWSELVNTRIALRRTAMVYHGDVQLAKLPPPDTMEPPTKKIKSIHDTESPNKSNSARTSLNFWDDATVIIRKLQVIFSPRIKCTTCAFFIDGIGLHGIGEET